MKKILALAFATTMAAPAMGQAAADADSPMAGAFGNTLVSTAPNGAVTQTYIDPDGTYRSIALGMDSRGRWSVWRGQICYSQTSPAPAPPLCSLGPKKKVNSKWTIFHGDGSSTKVTIIPGRAGLPGAQ